jgi:outer membrane receptor protein involved in Fe transport
MAFSHGVLLVVLVAFQDPLQSDDRAISGIVEDPSGGAIAGAAVVIRCGSRTTELITDASGGFNVRGLPAVGCEVEASSPLFETTRVQVDLSSRGSAYVRVVLSIEGFETEVVVTPARGDAEPVFDVPEAVGVTTREELESRPFNLLPQAIREETGVLVQQTTPAQASVFIRGFSAQRVVYLVDGVRLNTSTFRTGATQYLGWINPALVQQLEIVRGPASVQYGSDALGGAVNVIAFEPPVSPTGRQVSGSVEGTAGSADLTGGISATLLVQQPRLALQVGGSGRRVGELRTGRGRDSHAAVTRFLGLPSSELGTRLRDTDFFQGGGYVTGRIVTGDRGAIRAIYMHEEQADVTRYDRTLGGDGVYRSEFDPQRLDFGLFRYERQTGGPVDVFSLGASINRQQDDRLEQARPLSRIERERGRVVAFGYQAQASGTWRRHGWLVGGELYDEHIATSREFEDAVTGARQFVRPEIPDGSRYVSTGLFAQDTWEVAERLSVRGGLRFAHFRYTTDRDDRFGVADERLSAGALTFHTGLVAGLTPWLNATFTASRGFRAANALDLGAIGLGGGGFELSPAAALGLGGRIGTSDGADAVSTGIPVRALEPEALYSFEAGFKVRAGPFSASLAVFDLELVEVIQRRTAIFASSVVGTSIAGYAIVRQDEAGRAYVAEDPRPIVTRVNVDRARVRGVEADVQWRLGAEWLAGASFSLAHGRDLATGHYLRRMPPPFGNVRLKWEPTQRSFWIEGAATVAGAQTRLSPGDLGDPRIGARRTTGSIATFFNGTATDLGLVSGGVLLATGESLAQVQQRVLGGATSAPLFESTPGFLVLGMRTGWHVRRSLTLTLIADNLTDRNYRWHGSGVDGSGGSLQVRARYSF